MERIDTDTATVVGLWAGLGGLLVGFAGIGLTLYSFYRDKPEILTLTASGWAAALLTAVVMGLLGKRLVALASALSQQVTELSVDIAELRAEKSRLITIGEYLASQTTRTARRKQAAPAETIPSGD
ncbi:MAG: hypothetical protein V4754_13130 [Pseudomonadota bacterium]